MQPPSYTHAIVLEALFTKWNAHQSGERILSATRKKMPKYWENWKYEVNIIEIPSCFHTVRHLFLGLAWVDMTLARLHPFNHFHNFIFSRNRFVLPKNRAKAKLSISPISPRLIHMKFNQAGRWRNQKKSGQNIPVKPTDGARLSMIPPHGLPRNHGTRLIRDLLQEMSGKSLGLQVTQIILVNSWLCLKLDCTGLRLGDQNSWRVSFRDN